MRVTLPVEIASGSQEAQLTMSSLPICLKQEIQLNLTQTYIISAFDFVFVEPPQNV